MTKLSNIIKTYNSVLYEAIPLDWILTQADKHAADLLKGQILFLENNNISWVWLETGLVIPLCDFDLRTEESISFITKDPLTEETQDFLTKNDIYNWTGYSSFITSDLDTYLKNWILITK